MAQAWGTALQAYRASAPADAAGHGRPMRLEGSGLACVRGGREVFAGLEFSVGGGEALLVTGRNGAGKSSLLRMIAGLVRLAGGRLALTGGDPERTIPEQAHYLGHQDALKPSLTVAREPARSGRAISAAARAAPEAALGRGGPRRAGRPAGGLPVGRPAAAAVASPGCWPCSGRSGCSTSRPRRSTATAQDTLAGLMRRASRRRRADRRGDPRPDRARRRAASCGWEQRA